MSNIVQFSVTRRPLTTGPVLTDGDIPTTVAMSNGLPTTPVIAQLELGSVRGSGSTDQVTSVLSPLRSRSDAIATDTVGVRTSTVTVLDVLPPGPIQVKVRLRSPGVGNVRVSPLLDVDLPPLQPPEALQLLV